MKNSAAYVRRWFVEKSQFAVLVGPVSEILDDLLAEKAFPGVIYSQSTQGDWWSALGAALGHCPAAPPLGGTDWYSPAATWWCRRAALSMRAGCSAAEAAALNKEKFITDFIAELNREPHAPRAFPACFPNDELDRRAARQAGEKEWGDWIDGPYAVCLRRFSAESCVRKESWAKRLRDHFDGQGEALDDLAMFDLVEALESLMLPFAPSERPSGTPGEVVDRALDLLRLGRELPYAGVVGFKGE
ncbi:hypothetical protein IC614_07360 [Allosphingosinicella flava]|uniref:Uncharacterized protein n=1 Tax=Allosphingosinicella flava TaxID=2771430 RepID=A0A7T2GHX0_9SPHN|nr:DUF6058 family natural product biosynthesis protein [Sphingosinicella flava]QPQ54185.1 hypothetical protein IC614_07360 [Sphingosinicella flava]